jgi:hypothetical protein
VSRQFADRGTVREALEEMGVVQSVLVLMGQLVFGDPTAFVVHLTSWVFDFFFGDDRGFRGLGSSDASAGLVPVTLHIN